MAAAPAQPAGTTCSACGTNNPPGMNFCKMCGTSLGARPAGGAQAVHETAAVTPSPQPSAQKSTCPACNKQTPAGFAFCQHCGQRLGAGPAPSPTAQQPTPTPSRPQPSHQPEAVAPTMAVNPTPPAGMQPARVSAPAPAPRISQPIINEDALAATMAPPAAVEAARQSAKNNNAASGPFGTASHQQAAAPHQKKISPDTMREVPPSSGTLIALNRDGSDGEAVQIVGDAFDLGRSEGSLTFGEDPYLAPRHARLVVQHGKIILRPLDTVNGVYVKVNACDLSPGDQFLVGKELLRYEPLPPEERDPPSLMEHGVRIFGSVPREAWGRLRQLTVAGTTRDVWHLVRPELVLGREEGDVTFPDDEFMSRRHAAVRRAGAKIRLEDLNSSNGTFVRVRGDRELKPGDVIRVGDQLLRLEQ